MTMWVSFATMPSNTRSWNSPKILIFPQALNRSERKAQTTVNATTRKNCFGTQMTFAWTQKVNSPASGLGSDLGPAGWALSGQTCMCGHPPPHTQTKRFRSETSILSTGIATRKDFHNPCPGCCTLEVGQRQRMHQTSSYNLQKTAVLTEMLNFLSSVALTYPQ